MTERSKITEACAATIILAGMTTKDLAGGEESEAA